MVRMLARIAFAIALLVPLGAASAFDAGERAEIETIVREYLLSNPEILVEVSDELRARRAAEAAAGQEAAIAELGETIFESERQVVLGNPDGDVTLVEFFDYNCGYCRAALPDILALVEEDGNLRVVLKELVALGEPSLEAARVAVAVHLEDTARYRDFHTALLSERGSVDAARALAVAESVGFAPDVLVARLSDPEVEATLEEVSMLANALGVTGTPSFVLGNEVIVGMQDIDTLRDKIAAVRACGSTTC